MQWLPWTLSVLGWNGFVVHIGHTILKIVCLDFFVGWEYNATVMKQFVFIFTTTTTTTPFGVR